MHEYSVVSALLDQVHQHARSRGATAVKHLYLAVGELSGLDCGLFETAYAAFRERTVCADAALSIRHVPASWACSECGVPMQPGALTRCAVCSSPGRLVEGDGIVLERIEMEVGNV